jgi:hypothetical protein
MQQVKRSLFDVVSLTWGTSKPSFSTQAPLLARERPQGFLCTEVFSRAFWIDTGISPSSTKPDLISIIISEGFTSRGHLIVQAPQDVQYQGIFSSIDDLNCFFLTSILILKGVFPASGQPPVHCHIECMSTLWSGSVQAS